MGISPHESSDRGGGVVTVRTSPSLKKLGLTEHSDVQFVEYDVSLSH
jgi:hypothetical protein